MVIGKHAPKLMLTIPKEPKLQTSPIHWFEMSSSHGKCRDFLIFCFVFTLEIATDQQVNACMAKPCDL
ncbi:hypothetical protein SETIT_5G194200v2 [Setaria italica]|uniref:Uncharacterized protein n=2 Tax=Setaria TaxID=4554 RepID=A0A368R6H3_SETIT|nr:hypothetical protein SETIT_5G194200v2 [Setaria italica]TKW14881.1 hypothetical protein SEVIR_5G196300v2 [Setaria viridis]